MTQAQSLGQCSGASVRRRKLAICNLSIFASDAAEQRYPFPCEGPTSARPRYRGKRSKAGT